MAREAKMAPSTLWKDQQGDPTVSDKSREKAENHMGWPAGTLRRIAAGETAPPPSMEDRLAALEGAVDEIRQMLSDELAKQRRKGHRP
jgi:hypothetical protein